MSETIRSVSMPVGVVIARVKIDHPWQEYEWKPTGLLPGAGEINQWKLLREHEGYREYHAITLPLELHRKETPAYQVNLQDEHPAVYIVFGEPEDEDFDEEAPLEIQLITASPFEAQDYLDSGEVMVERLPMPEGMMVWVTKFVEEFHTEEKFKKRQRDKLDIEDHKFGQEPIFERRKRMKEQLN